MSGKPEHHHSIGPYGDLLEAYPVLEAYSVLEASCAAP
jgi:hypothetical protein